MTIGLAMVDIGQVNETFGLDLTVTPVEEMHEAWAEVLNAAGGINGRSVELVYRGMQPVGPEDSDRICLELMEDEEVFVVIGQFLQDAMLCITETYGHPYVGHFGETPERQEKSDGLLFAAEIAQVDQRGGGTQAMIDAGDFDDKAVAVVWESDADRVYWETVEPILTAGGVDVVASLEVNAFTTDTISNEAAWDIAMEQIQVAEADIILNLSGITRGPRRGRPDRCIADDRPHQRPGRRRPDRAGRVDRRGGRTAEQLRDHHLEAGRGGVARRSRGAALHRGVRGRLPRHRDRPHRRRLGQQPSPTTAGPSLSPCGFSRRPAPTSPQRRSGQPARASAGSICPP